MGTVDFVELNLLFGILFSKKVLYLFGYKKLYLYLLH